MVAALTLWGVTTVVFLLLRVLPGDPALTALAGSGASEAAVAQVRSEMGLDEPLPMQYGRYLFQMARGELGRSLFSNRPVALVIGEQVPATLELAAAAMLITVVVGLGLVSPLYILH